MIVSRSWNADCVVRKRCEVQTTRFTSRRKASYRTVISSAHVLRF